MARNAIESDFRSSEMAQIRLPKWSPGCGLFFLNSKKKLRIDLKWWEMRSKVIFGHPKWPPAGIWKKIKKKSSVLIWNGEKCDRKWFLVINKIKNKKVVHLSEMARNAIKSDFRSSKMNAGGYFVKTFKKKLCIDPKWREMRSNIIFGYPKMAAGGNFAGQKYKSCVLIRNSEIVDRNWFSVIQNCHKATRGGGGGETYFYELLMALYFF